MLCSSSVGSVHGAMVFSYQYARNNTSLGPRQSIDTHPNLDDFRTSSLSNSGE